MTTVWVVLLLMGILIVGILTIYVYLVVRKVNQKNLLKKQQKWLEQNLNTIENYVVKGELSVSFFPNEEYQFSVMEEIFSHYLGIIQFEKDFDPIRPIINRYLLPRYRKKLVSRRWAERMNALYFIHQFGIKSMKNDLISHLDSANCSVEERFEIFLILARFRDQSVFTLIKRHKQMPSFLLTECLKHFTTIRTIDSFLMDWHELDQTIQYALLDVIRVKHFLTEKTQALLESLIQSSDLELRIRSYKTIASIGYLSKKELVLNRINTMQSTEEWDNQKNTSEKLMLTRLMGSIRSQDFLPILHQLISDRAYSVRSEAARSIRKYKNGEELLLEINKTHLDAYARQIAQEWLERVVFDE